MGNLTDRLLRFVVGDAGVARTAILVWAAASLLMLVATGGDVGRRFDDPDDAMRLAEVRDLLGGQGWFDTTQYRVAPPAGLPMHWSRIIDVGLAGLFLAARLLLDIVPAERAAMAAWPLLLLLAATWAVTAISRHIASPAASFPAALLFITSAAAVDQFYPGHVAHHNAQLLATLILVAGAIRMKEGPRFGMLAGLGAALMLAIGLETILYLIVVVAYIALLLAYCRRAVVAAVQAFGLSFGIGTAALALMTMAPSRIMERSCDMLSLPLTLAAVVGGIGLAALAGPVAQSPRMPVRLVLLALLGVIVCTVAFGIAPQCLHGPFAGLDPRLWPIWLDHDTGIQGMAAFLRDDPWGTLARFHLALLTVPAWVLAMWAFPDRRGETGVLGILFAVALGVAYVRSSPYFLVFAAPIVAVAIAHLARIGIAWGMAQATGTAAALIATIALPLLIRAPAALAAKPSPNLQNATMATTGRCAEPASYTPLANLPEGVALAPIYEAPFILVASRQQVLAAGYHRDEKGILATYSMFTAPEQEAHRLLAARGIRYVVLCRGEGSAMWLGEMAPTGLAADLLAGRTPDWLEAIAPANGEPLMIFRVR
ncbi:MAG: hypothetical protein JO273_07685 [Methylobacteriaceae bacterium]|nr:hypothetical protein [Methylobacteriaceae bacterium]